MCPFGDGQIQTLVQAGGMASARIRAIVSASRTGVPSAARYPNALPRRTRAIPGALSLTYRSRAAVAASMESAGSVAAGTELATSVWP